MLACTVRGCGRALVRGPTAFACAEGHSFDVARAGHVNLLQPQDKRSASPGDSREIVAARRRLASSGLLEPLHGALVDVLQREGVGAASDVLDVGCGEGSLLAAVRARLGAAVHGVDLSVAAVESAARSCPEGTWVIANADRGLPYASDGFDATLSVDSRVPATELRRVLRGRGLLAVAVPATDDLGELREAVLGRADVKDRMGRVLSELEESFELVGRCVVRSRTRLEPAVLRDLLAATYRGARERARARVADLEALEVTLAHDLAWLRARTAA